MSKQDKGVAVGAAGGAVIGGIIGNNVGNKKNTALGAIIGAAVGGVAGGIIGAKMDRQAEKIKTEIPGAKVERIGEGIRVTFDEANPDGSKAGVYFATNKYDITPNSKLALDKLIKIFSEYAETNLLIEGHTDDVGTDAYNLSLSERRAEAVSNYLRNSGIASARLITKWYGESQPVADNTTAANRALNRRVEFVITANEKMKEEAKVEADAKQ
jgi:outer membrane protein OmpA-like peptidoglycan-associated protein